MLIAPDEGKSRRSDLAELGVKTAVAGFGLSVGRGAYRGFKDNWLVVAIISAALLGSGFGVWNLVRGHPASSSKLLRALTAIGLAVAGSGVSFGLVVMFSGDAAVALVVSVFLQVLSVGIGAIVGAAQRSGRLLRFSTEDHNRRFLDGAGLIEVGGSDNTLTDSHGNEMVVDDWRRDRIVLRRTNGRGVGHISLDSGGRMLQYSPPG